MTNLKKILVAVALGVVLYGGVYIYALNSEAFRFVKGALENSYAISQRVGTGAKVTLPLFGEFKEKHVNSNATVIMTVTVRGRNKTISVSVIATRRNGMWELESASTGGIPIIIESKNQNH
jgi:anionic cell wall polymer biosynthesis LytR-Cps2A-Psr (LCP) family protein